MKKINVAIIGQGRSGRSIHANFFASPLNVKFNVVAVVDIIPKRRQAAAVRFGCDTYADYTELFSRNDIDVVVNSTFSHLHAPITRDLLQHGLNVICEKPFAANAAEAQSVIECAKQNRRMLAVFQQSRFAPYYIQLKQILSSGKLGTPVQISARACSFARRWDWQTAQEYAGGSVRNTGPHPLDQILDLMGFPSDITVFSRLGRVMTFGDAEDYAKIILTVPNGPLADLEISNCNGFDKYTFLISCTHGTLRCTHQKIDIKYFDPATAPEQRLILEPLSDKSGKPMHCKENLNVIEEHYDIEGTVFDKGVEWYYDMIYSHLTEGTPLTVTPAQILCQMKIIDQVHAQNPLTKRNQL